MLRITADGKEPKPTIFMLVKFFEKPTFAADFVSGRMFCNTVASFKKHEDPGNSGRLDRNEGTIAWLQPGQGRLEINGIDLTPALAEPLKIQRSWLDYLHLFCMHAVHAGKFDLANLSNETIEDFRQALLIPNRCGELGTHAAVVTSVREFVSRMETAAQLRRYQMWRDLVEYYDPATFHGGFEDVQALFRKQQQDSYQREFRFVINTGLESGSPLWLNIGSIADITLRFDAAELNGEQLLGGNIEIAR